MMAADFTPGCTKTLVQGSHEGGLLFIFSETVLGSEMYALATPLA